MRKWDIDFSDIPIKELVRLPIRWGKLDLGGLFADIENELTQPIQWASYGKVILPDYASKILVDDAISCTVSTLSLFLIWIMFSLKEILMRNKVSRTLFYTARGVFARIFFFHDPAGFSLPRRVVLIFHVITSM